MNEPKTSCRIYVEGLIAPVASVKGAPLEVALMIIQMLNEWAAEEDSVQ